MTVRRYELPDEATARRVALDLLAALVGVAEEG